MALSIRLPACEHGVQARLRAAHDNTGSARQHQIHVQAEVFDQEAVCAIRSRFVGGDRYTLVQRSIVIDIGPYRLAKRSGKTHFERGSAVRLTGSAKVVQVGEDDIGGTNGIHVCAANPLRFGTRLEFVWNLSVERIETDHSAGLAERFQMLTVTERVAAEDVEPSEVDARSGRSALDGQRGRCEMPFAHFASNPVQLLMNRR